MGNTMITSATQDKATLMYYKYNEGFKYYNGHLCYT